MILLDKYSFYNSKNLLGKYNVNVYKNARTVHKKDGCYNSQPYQFIPFDTLEDIENFEKMHNIKFTFCQDPKCGFKK